MNSEASQLKDQDLVQFIENKLGDPNELWAGRQASSLLNRQMIVELETCFQRLEPHVKLKIIHAIIHLSPKLVQLWREPLTNLLNLARRDADDWVETVADLFRDYPSQGCIQCTPSNSDSFYFKTLAELRRILKEKIGQSSAPLILPPDCAMISHSAIATRYGFSKIESKTHFVLSKIPKSQLLLEEVEKAAEQQNNPAHKKQSVISSFPIKMRSTARKPNNNLPMKGIPSVNTNKISGGFTNEPKKFQRQLSKREGGAMLIDIAELPQHQIGPGRKRKVNLEMSQKPKKAEISTEGTLKSRGRSTKIKTSPTKISESTSLKTSSIDDEDENIEHGCKALPSTSFSPPKFQTQSSGTNRSQDMEKSRESQLNPIRFVKGETQPDNHNQEMLVHDAQNFSKTVLQEETQHATSLRPSLPAPASYIDEPTSLTVGMPTMLMEETSPGPSNSHNLPTVNLKDAISKQLEDLMQNANRITTASYKLISAFLSGDRVNPLQDKLGPVVTLPLSENIEFDVSAIMPAGGPHVIETFFQMDYRTGEWKRLRKSRVFRPDNVATCVNTTPTGVGMTPLPLDAQPSMAWMNQFGALQNLFNNNANFLNNLSNINNNSANFLASTAQQYQQQQQSFAPAGLATDNFLMGNSTYAANFSASDVSNDLPKNLLYPPSQFPFQ